VHVKYEDERITNEFVINKVEQKAGGSSRKRFQLNFVNFYIAYFAARAEKVYFFLYFAFFLCVFCLKKNVASVSFYENEKLVYIEVFNLLISQWNWQNNEENVLQVEQN